MVEYKRFTADPKAEWKTNLNSIRLLLRTLFNLIDEKFTKMIASHLGGHNVLTDIEICAVSAICSAANGIKFNRGNFFVHQLCEAAKDFKVSKEDPTRFTVKGKLRYAGCISYALEKLFPDRIWEEDWSIYKKHPIFNDLLEEESPLLMPVSSTSTSLLP